MTSAASQTNRALTIAASVLLACAVVVPFIAATSQDSEISTPSGSSSPASSSSTTVDESSDTTVPREPFEGELDAGDYEGQSNESIDPAIGKRFIRDRNLKTATLSYPFPEIWPERNPPVRINPFVSDTFDIFNGGGGIQQSPFIPDAYRTGTTGLTCKPKEWYGLMACGVGSTSRGRYQIVVTRYETDALNWPSFDALTITVYVEGTRGEDRYVYSALKFHLSVSKCIYASSAGKLALQKIRVGADDVFVLSMRGDFLPISDNDFSYNSSQVAVIAMNSTGMPEVIASYRFANLQQVAATDRSLILTIGDSDSMWDEDIPYGTGHVIELMPNANGWKERIHPLVYGREPLWGVANYEVRATEIGKGIGKPLTLLDYTSLYHIRLRATFCREDEDE